MGVGYREREYQSLWERRGDDSRKWRRPGSWGVESRPKGNQNKRIDSAVVDLDKGRCSTHYFGSAADPDVCRSQSARSWPGRCNEKMLRTLSRVCYTAVDELCVNAQHEMLLLGKELQFSILWSAGEAGRCSASDVATRDIENIWARGLLRSLIPHRNPVALLSRTIVGRMAWQRASAPVQVLNG